MKKLLLFLFIFSIQAGAYYPLALTPETLQSIRVGYEDKSLNIGGELAFTGDKKNIVKKWFGDNLKWNHSLTAGFVTNNFQNPAIYGAAYLFFESGSIGTGAKQMFFYDSNFSSAAHTESIYFAYYYFESSSIFFNDKSEFLSVYIGFRTQAVNLVEKNLGEFFSSLKDLHEVPILGIYYNPDVTETVSIGFETDFNTVIFNLYFSFF